MRKITTGEKVRLQESQTDTFFDSCQIGTFSSIKDSYGDIIKSYNYGSSIDCGASILSGYETINGQVTYTGVLARIRLPAGSILFTQDRVKIGGIDYGVRSITGKYSVIVDLENVVV